MRRPADGRPTAVLRFDAEPAIGGGHAVRCLALAQALTSEGWRCNVATIRAGVDIVRHIFPTDIAIFELPHALTDEPAALAALWPNGCDLLIVDNYRWTKGQTSKCRGWASKILVVDDLCDRPHDCDLLLNPALGRRPQDYRPLTPPACRLLLNPGHAPLREEFATVRLATTTEARDRERIFINFGLLDAANLTETTLRAFEQVSFTGSLDVVMGANSPHLQRIRSFVASSPLRIALHIEPEEPSKLLVGARLVVGAGGGGVWERCCLGLPSLVLTAAKNQEHNARTLAEHGASEWLPVEAIESLPSRLRAILEDDERLTAMAHAASAITDGLGARRVAIALAPPTAHDSRTVTLRRATFEDASPLLDWQRHPQTRRYARNPRIPAVAEHEAWLRKKLRDPGSVLDIIQYDDSPAGALRLDRLTESGYQNAFEISIYMDPNLAGLGIGRAALAAAHRLLPAATLLAHVHPDNAPSHALFRAAGFVRHDEYYVRTPTHSRSPMPRVP